MDPKAPRYVLPNADELDMGDDKRPAGRVDQTTIASLGLEVGRSFGYWFDFGDDWIFIVGRTRTAPQLPNKGRKYPRLLGTRGDTLVQYPPCD